MLQLILLVPVQAPQTRTPEDGTPRVTNLLREATQPSGTLLHRFTPVSIYQRQH